MTDIRRLFTKSGPADITKAYELLARAAADGVPVPHMAVIWNSPLGPEVSMNVCTADEFAAWAQWLEAKPRTIHLSIPREIADTTLEGVRFFLGTRADEVAS